MAKYKHWGTIRLHLLRTQTQILDVSWLYFRFIFIVCPVGIIAWPYKITHCKTAQHALATTSHGSNISAKDFALAVYCTAAPCAEQCIAGWGSIVWHIFLLCVCMMYWMKSKNFGFPWGNQMQQLSSSVSLYDHRWCDPSNLDLQTVYYRHAS